MHNEPATQPVTLPTTNPLINLSIITKRTKRWLAAKVGVSAVSLWIHTVALAEAYREMQKILVGSVINIRHADLDLHQAGHNVSGINSGDMAKRLAAVVMAYAVITASPEYAAARDLVEPLLVEATAQATIDRQDEKKAKEHLAEMLEKVEGLKIEASDLTASRTALVPAGDGLYASGSTEPSEIERAAVAELQEAMAELEKAKESVERYRKIFAGEL